MLLHLIAVALVVGTILVPLWPIGGLSIALSRSLQPGDSQRQFRRLREDKDPRSETPGLCIALQIPRLKVRRRLRRWHAGLMISWIVRETPSSRSRRRCCFPCLAKVTFCRPCVGLLGLNS